MSSRMRAVSIFAFGLGVGILSSFVFVKYNQKSLEGSFGAALMPIQSNETVGQLVRPLLAYRTPEAPTYGEYVELKKALESDVAKIRSELGASRVSLYFRDLNIARWVGIDQDSLYHPASLMKVPLMIAYFKDAEKNPLLFHSRLTYHTFPSWSEFEDDSQLVVGKSYSVAELIERMIVESDNGAAFLLLEHISPEVLSTTYTALGISEPDDYTYQISARTYGLFFRILYNATYLSPASSEKALALLTKTSFSEGLPSGVQAGVTVAHKWGEHVSAEHSKTPTIEFSDCGIVYYPQHPYLLCVMTHAKDEQSATQIVRMISKTAYDAVAERYPANE